MRRGYRRRAHGGAGRGRWRAQPRECAGCRPRHGAGLTAPPGVMDMLDTSATASHAQPLTASHAQSVRAQAPGACWLQAQAPGAGQLRTHSSQRPPRQALPGWVLLGRAGTAGPAARLHQAARLPAEWTGEAELEPGEAQKAGRRPFTVGGCSRALALHETQGSRLRPTGRAPVSPSRCSSSGLAIALQKRFEAQPRRPLPRAPIGFLQPLHGHARCSAPAPPGLPVVQPRLAPRLRLPVTFSSSTLLRVTFSPALTRLGTGQCLQLFVWSARAGPPRAALHCRGAPPQSRRPRLRGSARDVPPPRRLRDRAPPPGPNCCNRHPLFWNNLSKSSDG